MPLLTLIDVFTLVPHVKSADRILVSYMGPKALVTDPNNKNISIAISTAGPREFIEKDDSGKDVLMIEATLSLNASCSAREFFLACGRAYLYSERTGGLGNQLPVERDPATHKRENIRFVMEKIKGTPEISMGEVMDSFYERFGDKYGRPDVAPRQGRGVAAPVA